MPLMVMVRATPASKRTKKLHAPHPLARDRSVSEGITEERGRLNAIRKMSDLILDTSNLTVHELRDVFMRMSREGGSGRQEMVVNLVSFGFKAGVPMDADLVFDVRCLPNPHFVEGLRRLTGRDAAVVRYMRKHQATHDFLDRLTSFLRFALPQYVREGKSYLTISFGCTGGHHRSVMMAGEIRKRLAASGYRVKEHHRDIKK